MKKERRRETQQNGNTIKHEGKQTRGRNLDTSGGNENKEENSSDKEKTENKKDDGTRLTEKK